MTPDRADQPDYIINLIQRVITVSVETVKIINALPALAEKSPSCKQQLEKRTTEDKNDETIITRHLL